MITIDQMSIFQFYYYHVIVFISDFKNKNNYFAKKNEGRGNIVDFKSLMTAANPATMFNICNSII